MSMNARDMAGQGYLTVEQAARQLAVHPSTIRRWIDRGRLPAYRLGEKRIGLRPSDLARMVRPRSETGRADNWAATISRELTPEEQERGLEALAELERMDDELLRRRGGKPFAPAWELLNETRDDRARSLTRD